MEMSRPWISQSGGSALPGKWQVTCLLSPIARRGRHLAGGRPTKRATGAANSATYRDESLPPRQPSPSTTHPPPSPPHLCRPGRLNASAGRARQSHANGDRCPVIPGAIRGENTVGAARKFLQPRYLESRISFLEPQLPIRDSRFSIPHSRLPSLMPAARRHEIETETATASITRQPLATPRAPTAASLWPLLRDNTPSITGPRETKLSPELPLYPIPDPTPPVRHSMRLTALLCPTWPTVR